MRDRTEKKKRKILEKIEKFGVFDEVVGCIAWSFQGPFIGGAATFLHGNARPINERILGYLGFAKLE